MTEKKRKAVYNPEAAQRWNEKNRDRKRYLTDRTSARRFIRDKATEEDLQELEGLIKGRRETLRGE